MKGPKRGVSLPLCILSPCRGPNYFLILVLVSRSVSSGPRLLFARSLPWSGRVPVPLCVIRPTGGPYGCSASFQQGPGGTAHTPLFPGPFEVGPGTYPPIVCVLHLSSALLYSS